MRRTAGVQGFLLTEVLVVIIIFSLGMVGALTALNHASRIVTRAALSREARSAAEEALATVRMIAEVSDAEMPTTFPSRTVGTTMLSVSVEREELTAVQPAEEVDAEAVAMPESEQVYYHGMIIVRDNAAVIYELPFVIRSQKGAV